MHTVESDEPRRGPRLRFSLLALFVFMTVTCVALFWWTRPQPYLLEALFHLNASPPPLVAVVEHPFDAEAYRRFQRTQRELIKSDQVLIAALRDPTIAALPVLKDQDDQVAWLREQLEVASPQDSELLQIRLHCTENAIADHRRIVDAVADAYVREVLFAEERQGIIRREDLTKQSSELREKIRNKLLALREQIGAGADDIDAKLLQDEIDVLKGTWQKILLAIEDCAAERNAPSRVMLIQRATALPE